MGIKELAAAAAVAEEARVKAERKRIWAVNARRGEQTVYDIIGVEGKATRANNAEEKPHGDNTIVHIEDDMYVKVAVRNVYGKRPYYGGETPIIGEKVGLFLTDEKGNTPMGHYDPFYSLYELNEVLLKVEAYNAKKTA